MKLILLKQTSNVLACYARKRRRPNRYSGVYSHNLEFILLESVSFAKGESDDAEQRRGNENRSFVVSIVCCFEREAVEEGRDHTEEDEWNQNNEAMEYDFVSFS